MTDPTQPPATPAPSAARAALAQQEAEGPRELQCPASVARGRHDAAAEAESGSPLQQLLAAAGDLLERCRPPAPPAPEVIEAVGNCARIELVVALHALASQFENETAAFTGDDLEAVQGHVKHARKIAAKHNRNGPGCAPPVPEAGEVWELVAVLEQDADRGEGLFCELSNTTAEQFARAAELLQQQESRIANLRLALTESGRAVGSTIGNKCSDSFLLQVPQEVRLAMRKAAPAPAVVPVAEDIQHLVRFMCRTWVAIDEWASMWNEAMETYPMIQGTRNQMNLREIAAQPYDIKRVAIGVQLMLSAKAIPLPQVGEVEA